MKYSIFDSDWVEFDDAGILFDELLINNLSDNSGSSTDFGDNSNSENQLSVVENNSSTFTKIINSSGNFNDIVSN